MPPDKAGVVEKIGDTAFPLAAGLPEEAAEKRDVLAHAEIGIKVLAEALRHVGNARAHPCAVRGIRHVAVEDLYRPRLDVPGAGDDRQERRFADTIGPDQSDQNAGRQSERHAIERGDLSIALGDTIEARDGAAARDHGDGFPCSCGGQVAFGSVCT
jgi:hypothetical protein